MAYLLIATYSLFFLFLSHKNFRLAIGLFIIGLPTYLIRFKIGPLPSTLLELNFGIIFVVWLLKFARADWKKIKYLIFNHKYLFISLSLFFLASVISIFVSDMWYYSLGQWRAYFLEPLLFFVILAGRLSSPPFSKRGAGGVAEVLEKTEPTTSLLAKRELTTTDILWFLALSTLSISVFGLMQRFTGWHVGNVDWIAAQTGRITSFFTSPNAVGLYLGPIILLIVGVTIEKRTKKSQVTSHKSKIISNIQYLILALSLVALFLSKSIGAIAAVGLGVLVFIFLMGYKKIVLILIMLTLLTTPYTLQLLTHKSQSTANRLTLWKYSYEYLTTSPKNFIFGTGIRQFFRKVQKPHYEVKKMERLIYPHNIILNFWTEIGLLGMLSFVVLYCYIIRATWYMYKNTNKLFGAALLTSLVIWLVHGLIDVPYFKNDLAMLFWIITAVIISSNNHPIISNEREKSGS